MERGLYKSSRVLLGRWYWKQGTGRFAVPGKTGTLAGYPPELTLNFRALVNAIKTLCGNAP